MKPATIPANIAESMETPINVSAPPMPMQASVAAVPPGLPNIPIAMRMRPGSRTALPAAMRMVRGRAVFPPVRKASSGVTREARSAGSIAEARVTPMPTTATTMIVLVRISRGPSGNSPPADENSCLRAEATPRPPTKPRPDAARPIEPASINTICMICLLLAPIDRIRPNIRVRWPTRVANVLLMMKVLTKSTTIAKPSKTLPKMLMNEPKSSFCSPMTTSPVTASRLSGRTSEMAVTSPSGLTPSAAATTTESTWPGSPSTRCAVGRSNRMKNAPPVPPSPKSMVPLNVKTSGCPEGRLMVISWPTLNPPRSA